MSNSRKNSKKVLVCVDYYLPGYKAGGPVRTISNMISQLDGKYLFYVITRNRDKGSSLPYESRRTNEWNKVENSCVYYSNRSMFGHWFLLNKTPYDLLYLNSFFSPQFTFLPLVARRLSRNYDIPVVLAPRGELSAGAMSLKKIKKQLYIWLAKKIGLYRNVHWHASNIEECDDLRKQLGLSLTKRVSVVPNMLPKVKSFPIVGSVKNLKIEGELKLTFLSRICRMKNLHFLLLSLRKVNSKITLQIYGPVEDLNYWSQCSEMLSALPENIDTQYHGEIEPKAVSSALAESDLFVLPTLGENFGHVIFESLAVGTPVMISDKTSWLEDHGGAIQAVPLETDLWAIGLDKCADSSATAWRLRQKAAAVYAKSYIEKTKAMEKNLKLFEDAIAAK